MKQNTFIKRLLGGCVALAVLLSGCGGTLPTEQTVQTSPEEPREDWILTGGWKTGRGEQGVTLTSPPGENASALLEPLGESWQIQVSAKAVDARCLRVLLGNQDGTVRLAAAVYLEETGGQLALEQWKYEKWTALDGPVELPLDAQQPLEIRLTHYADQQSIQISVTQDGAEAGMLRYPDVSLRTIHLLAKAGVGADGEAVFSGFTVEAAVEPETPVDILCKTMSPEEPGFYRALGEIAVGDVITNFWTGDTQTGKIRPTWEGYSEDLADPRGSIWETAMLVFGIYDMWAVTGDQTYYDLLTAEARFFRESFSEEELENAGGLFHWASDDCAWNCMMYLCFYSVTADQWFVERAIRLLDNVNARWYDEELNGLYYKDGVDFMSLYEVGIAWSWLRLWEITGEQRFYDLALRSYEGMHTRLGADRDDGLYYCEANVNWPVGDRERIAEAGSSSFLTGNMGMAALAAKFYRITGNQTYLERVYQTNQGLLRYYDNDGVLLNDRDAWTNGSYAAFYASEVLSLPDTEQMRTLVKNTAMSIMTNARTEDGYYGGSWSGPAEGSASVWYSGGSKPQQSMTTGTSVLMVTAAAILEAEIEHYVR